jgi:hypothetical protein
MIIGGNFMEKGTAVMGCPFLFSIVSQENDIPVEIQTGVFL